MEEIPNKGYTVTFTVPKNSEEQIQKIKDFIGTCETYFVDGEGCFYVLKGDKIVPIDIPFQSTNL